MTFRLIVAAAALAAALSAAPQADDFQIFLAYRQWVQSLPNAQRGNADQLRKLYAEKLARDGVAGAEVDRRMKYLRDGDKLEAEYWNRALTSENPRFNTEPNAFLVSIIKGRKPGAALDVGMGEGRNALYLARQGWSVTGIDVADRAVALARKRAADGGLKLHAEVADIDGYNYGRERWDLVLFSYVGIKNGQETKLLGSLKPGGIVVVEGLEDWFGENGLLKKFPDLRVIHFEQTSDVSDFHSRRQSAIVRFAGEKH